MLRLVFHLTNHTSPTVRETIASVPRATDAMVSRTVGDVFEHWLDSNECPIYSHSGLWCAVVYKRGVSCRFYCFQCDHVDPAHVRLSSVAVPGRGYLLRDSASRVGFFSPINECLTATFFSPSS